MGRLFLGAFAMGAVVIVWLCAGAPTADAGAAAAAPAAQGPAVDAATLTAMEWVEIPSNSGAPILADSLPPMVVSEAELYERVSPHYSRSLVSDGIGCGGAYGSRFG